MCLFLCVYIYNTSHTQFDSDKRNVVNFIVFLIIGFISLVTSSFAGISLSNNLAIQLLLIGVIYFGMLISGMSVYYRYWAD